MKKSFNRREFLKTSFLSAGTLFLSFSPLKLFSNTTTAVQNSNEPIDANDLYARAKEYFFKKEYNSAEKLYLQLIENYPGRIVYYDGYAKVLGAQQRMLEVAELYRVGLNRNSSNPYFMHRLSLNLRNLCTGNRKAEKLFVNKYGVENLIQYSAELLITAIGIKQVKGFMLDLRDLPVIVKERNEFLSKKGYEPIDLTPEYLADLNTQSSVVELRWNQTRASKKEFFSSEIDNNIEKIKNKKRRVLYTDKEKANRDVAVKKAKKERWKFVLSNAIQQNMPAKVDKYSLLILNDNINDTDTIGVVRNFYKKNKYHERLIALNRLLYTKNNSYINALSLASTLIKFSKENAAIAECKQILQLVEPYIKTLPAVNTGSYYVTNSQVLIKEGKPAAARKELLNGIMCFNGKGGIVYTLIEKYASSYTGKNIQEGILILKAICGKGYQKTDNAIWPYVDNYLVGLQEKPLHVREKIKQLQALAKLQKKNGNSEYSATLIEIQNLKASIN